MYPVFLTANYRFYYRSPILHQNELFCSPVSPTNEHEHTAPQGFYDVAAFLKTLPAPWRDPSLLVVNFDFLRKSVPQNLAAVKCPKVLFIGDTHHQVYPLQRVIHYAQTEPFDLVIVEFNRQHVHFFLEAGIAQARWLPSFTISPFEHAPGPRTRSLMFMGSVDHHPYRLHVLQFLENSGLQGQKGSGPREGVAQVYSETQVNLNISLNGDLNLRVFEVLAAGGFLLTDRLSPESGLDLLFEDGRHLVTCRDAAEFCDRARHFLAQPANAEIIAAAGHAQYLSRHTPAQKIADLHALLAGKVHESCDLRLDRRTSLPADNVAALTKRLALYEFLQEQHRTNMEFKVLFWSGLERFASDAIDLPRLQVTVLRSADPGLPNALQTAGLENRVEWLDRAPAACKKSQWNIIFCNQADLQDPLYQRFQQAQAGATTGVVDTWVPPSVQPYL